VAANGAADRAHHRLQLPRRHGSLHPPGARQAPRPPVDAATLDAFYARLRTGGGKSGRPLKASTIHEVPTVLSGALKQAVVWGWIGHNPAKLATAPSVQKAEVQPPQAEDAARLLAAATQESPELGLFLRLAVILGAHRRELCALRWPDIDFDLGEILIAGNVVRVPKQTLVHKDNKTHAKRRVAVGAGTLDLLRAHRVEQTKTALACGTALPPTAYVFSHVPDGSQPIDPDGVSHRFLKLARRLGVHCRYNLPQLVRIPAGQTTAELTVGSVPVDSATETATHQQVSAHTTTADLSKIGNVVLFDSLFVVPRPAGDPRGNAVTQEAETGRLSGAQVIRDDNPYNLASGKAFVRYSSPSGFADFTFTADRTGEHWVILRYANSGLAPSQMEITINGARRVATLGAGAGLGWYRLDGFRGVPLNAGPNQIRVAPVLGATPVDLDWVQVAVA
jgi:integrase